MNIKTLALLGSTGSIGESTLRVVDQFPDRFRIVALCAGKKIDQLALQAQKYNPRFISCADEADARELKKRLGSKIEIGHGPEGLLKAAGMTDAQMVVSALVGAVGLKPTYAALQRGADVAVANKETLVVAGEAIMAEARRTGAKLLPVDSEHSALFQALEGRRNEDVRRIILTASGGPFRGRNAEEIKNVTASEALKHPKWAMGPKISIDSATMMNKGLEVIEARWLFDMEAERISVTVHPQSIVHSLVEFIDGSMLAQLGVPDMRGPIAYALAHPQRLPMAGELALNLSAAGPLTFEEPDTAAFPCLTLAYEALKIGGTAPALLNGANEEAVGAYLEGRITFGDIPAVLTETLMSLTAEPARDLETALEADRTARDFAAKWIKSRRGG